MSQFIWTPQPKQAEFQRRNEYEVLYGGAAGGGKSDALITEALRQVNIPNYRGLIIRKTFPQLEALISRSLDLYPRIEGMKKAKYNSSSHTWTFPSGAHIFFGYMNRELDKLNYQGKSYDYIAFDELTHFTKSQYTYLMSRNRPTGPGTRVYIRATANPGGVGHAWVKERFITPAPPMTKIMDEYTVNDPKGKEIKVRRSRIFVSSTLFDNRILLENDPMYLANLASLPEAEKNALLYGNWDSFDGQVFIEWRNAPEHYMDRKWTHVVAPFKIPNHWRIYRGFDWGYSKPFSVGWYAVSEERKIYRIREYYGCKDENIGLKLEPVQVAKKIREIENEDPNLKGKQITGIADPAISSRDGGESIRELMERAGVYWNDGDHTRIAGKMQYHYRFAFDKDGECLFQIFNTCKNFIRTIPSLVYSQSNVEDIDTDMEDHIYDECRYVLMENIITAKENAERIIPEDDPLDLYKDIRRR